jgi:methionyl-tRNA synthetase
MARGLPEKSQEEQMRLKAMIAQTIYIMAETLRNMGILLQPYIPGKARDLLDVLGVPHENRTFEYCGFGKDFDYGVPMKEPGKSAQESLFPPLEVEN